MLLEHKEEQAGGERILRLLCSIASVIVLIGGATSASSANAGAVVEYRWSREIDSAAWEGSYNFPVFVVRNEMWALQARGAWTSRDGRTWVKSQLPASGVNTGYQRYVKLGDAIYGLGTMTGNYLDLHLTSRIMRTRDFKTWETIAATSNLPPRVFYGAVTYNDKMWMLGGYDGHSYYNDVWSSPDGVNWTREVEHAPWTPRNVDMVIEFKGRIWIIGGGVIDGQREINSNSKREVWSSADGLHWERQPDRDGNAYGGAPVVFDDQLWLIASNRNSTFAPSLIATKDGKSWREETAPWSPRGAPAVWVFAGKLFMAGGKYSVPVNGQPHFIYRNDVWSMALASGGR